MAFTFSIKDTYRQAVEAASGGKQTVLYDDKGYPSIMNIIPKLSYKDVGLSDSTKALPAFMVDDAEKPEIFVGTFMAMVHDGRACSLPGQVPKVYTNMDQAIAYCRATVHHSPAIMYKVVWVLIAVYNRTIIDHDTAVFHYHYCTFH